jgi:hypothetical protein
MSPVRTTPGTGGGQREEGRGKGEWWKGWIQVWHIGKKFYKGHNVPPLSTTIKKFFKKKLLVSMKLDKHKLSTLNCREEKESWK